MKNLKKYGVTSLNTKEANIITGGDAAPGSYGAGYLYGAMLSYAWNSFCDAIEGHAGSNFVSGNYTM